MISNFLLPPPYYQWTKIKDKCNIKPYVIMNTSTLIYSKDQVVFLGCFLVVFCKVRDTVLQRLNQGQVWKQWGKRWGKQKNRKNFLPCPHSGIPHCFLMWPQFSLSCISCFTNAKEKKNTKNQPAIQCGKQWIIESSQNKVLWFINDATVFIHLACLFDSALN